MGDVWARGEVYEAYMGRWSRQVAAGFVSWLAAPPCRRWLDVGCGTGALTSAVLAGADPSEVVGVDSSDGFVAHARERVSDPRARFEVGDALALPFPDARFDVVASGLVLNFVPDCSAAVAEFARVVVPAGTVTAYLWDYADGMEMLRRFWDAAVELDPTAAALDEGARFPLCRPDALRSTWAGAGFSGVTVEPVEVATSFRSFDDYWTPFLGAQGPAPGYVASLQAQHRDVLRDLLQQNLPTGPDGSIALAARAWAVRGTR